MKVTVLPRAPIQIQRDELIARVAALEKALNEKSAHIATLQAELSEKILLSTKQDQTIHSLQSEISVKNALITEQEEVIERQKSELSSREQLIEAKQSDIANLELEAAKQAISLMQQTEIIEDLENRLFTLEHDVVVLGEPVMDVPSEP